MDSSTHLVLRYIQRRVLLLSLIPLALLFAITAGVTGAYHRREHQLARQWFAAVTADLTGGRQPAALQDFQNALSYDLGNAMIELRLAETLLAVGRTGEAQAYLSTLWERSPGSGQINLDLARAAARAGNAEQAIHYYRFAIDGSWNAEDPAGRENAHLELSQYLLSLGRMADARKELAELSAEISPQAGELHELAGRQFLQAGDSTRALAEFEAAVNTEPYRSQWLEDAGRAAYGLGDYQKAATYLQRAIVENPSNELQALLETVRAVLRGDPYLPGLNDEEQIRRAQRAFATATVRLRTCIATITANPASQPPSELVDLASETKAFVGSGAASATPRDLHFRDAAMELVFRIERETARLCGPPAGPDQPLLTIANRTGAAAR